MADEQRPWWIRIVSTLVAPSVLLAIHVFPHTYVFIISCVVWFSFFVLLHVKYHVEKHQTALNSMTAVSFIILLLLIESLYMRWFLVGASVFIFFFIAYWSEPRIEHAIHIKEKPLRRMMMMLYVFNVYALFVALFAVHIYFNQLSFALLSIIGGVYAATGAYMIWSLYFKFTFEQLVVWCILVLLSIVEIMWVMKLLPFGYFASAFLLVWLWYIVQLFVRFHLSLTGILWKRQKWFLGVNAFLFFVVLYVIKWI